MGATGIGAPVRRKEDQRFVTGKGHYTDDISRPGQGHVHFLRSPHAHAKIKQIETRAAAAMPGVLAVLTGADLAADKIGNLICGWMIKSKDGSPMKMAAHPAIANGKTNFVGDIVAAVVADTLPQAADAAERIKVEYEVLPAVVVFALGLSAVVAPLTATVLATADVRHAGVASGVNNAVARAASLLFVAAIPPLAGLTGNAQSHPLVFLHGFRIAILASAALVACGAVLSFFTIRDDALRTAPAAAKPECTINCAVAAPPLEPGPEDARAGHQASGVPGAA